MQVRLQPADAPAQPAYPVPRHVAIIMDGNGRWASRQGLARQDGHRAGTENIRAVARCMSDRGVSYLTLYAFSTENWRRPQGEVEGLLGILGEALSREVEALHEDGVRLRHLGRPDRLSPELRAAIEGAQALTQDNPGLTLSVAFDYGSRDEILEAMRRMLADGVAPEQVDDALLARYLYTSDLPDPDLIIRTGGETRLSNFLLWQAAYSELYFTPVLWPDFDEAEAARALEEYGLRHRKYGGLAPDEER